MAILNIRPRKFKPGKELSATWTSFRKGLNTLLRDSELSAEQARQMQNLYLIGKGIVTQRPGSANLYQASTVGKIRGLFGSKINGVNELLAISDDGKLTKKNGTSSTLISGVSWASGYKIKMTQLRNKVYIVQPAKAMATYDGTTLTSYTTISAPTNLKATNLSGATGTFTYSWRVSAVTDAGRTLASDPVVLSNLPENCVGTLVRLDWTAPAGATGLIQSYEVYGREQNDEARMTAVSPSSTSWNDDGSIIPSLISTTPDFNETGGPNAKYIIKSVGKILVANVGSKKSRIMWSGAYVNAGKFSWNVGGGYTDIDEDDGTEITGIAEIEENRIVVWKERNIFEVRLSYNAELGIVEHTINKITDEVGCMSGDTIVNAINNHFFIGLRPGRGISLNSLGYEPNIAAAVLRTTEISRVIAPDLEAVNMSRLDDMFAVVYGGVYWWFFPIGTTGMRCYGYDLERLSFHGPHTFPDNPTVGTIWYDDTGMPRFVYGDGDDGYVTEVAPSYSSDKGADFTWSFKSRKEDFGLPFKLKTLLKLFIHVADVRGGNVNVQVANESDTGNTTTTTSFSVESNNQYAGFGSFRFGIKKFGHIDQASTSSTNSSEIRRYVDLNEPSVVTTQVQITGTGSQAKIISAQVSAREQYSPPASWQAV